MANTKSGQISSQGHSLPQNSFLPSPALNPGVLKPPTLLTNWLQLQGAYNSLSFGVLLEWDTTQEGTRLMTIVLK